MAQSFRKSHIVLATVGAIVAVSALAYIATSTGRLMLLGSFGASALLIFALPEAPLSQPRAVVFGHLCASLIAFACLLLFGSHWWSVGVATGLGVGMMMLTRTVHPPAGSNAIIVFLSKPAGGYLVGSTLLGTVTLVLIGAAYHRATRRHKYPLYWASRRLV
jgi:CBS-domain-containing membrane protein